MINFLQKIMQIVNRHIADYQQLRANSENENLALSCGTFNPKFLAKIKRSQADNNR